MNLRRDDASCGAEPWPDCVTQATNDVIFDAPLVDLVANAMCRRCFESLSRERLPPTAPSVDPAYVRRILDEEISRPFSHPLRPVIELILNGVDAYAGRHGQRIVDVTLAPGHVEVLDHGAGMSLATVLSRLLIPFATDKRDGEDLGRFGVGFLSALSYAIRDPASFSLEVATGNGTTSHVLRVTARSTKTEGLRASIAKAPLRHGTRVDLRASRLDPDSVRAYARETLHFLPDSKAVVRVSGSPINGGRSIDGGRLYIENLGEGHVARSHLGGRAVAPEIVAATHHAGVKLASTALRELVLVDFPGALPITEGRDAVEHGPLYDAVAIAFHRRLKRLSLSPNADTAAKHALAELAAKASALTFDSAGFAEVAAELADALLGDARYLVSPERAEAVVGFLGPHVASKLFVPQSFWAEREWYDYLPGETELVNEELFVDPPEPLSRAAARRPDLTGLGAIAGRAASDVTVALARARRAGPPGQLPCFACSGTVVIREDTASVREPRTWADLYALRAAFDRARGLREADVERAIIVSDPERKEAPTP